MSQQPASEVRPRPFHWCYQKTVITTLLIVAVVSVLVFVVRSQKTAVEPNSHAVDTAAQSHPGAKLDDAELRLRLTSEQYRVTREDGTEPPFHNAYWDNHAPGIYVDVVTGEPLFSSLDKFESGTGWPSFTKPVVAQNVVEKKDWSLLLPRTEVRSKGSDSHLGHVFSDGPAPTGQRYCMNSGRLALHSGGKADAEGYGQFRALFAAQK